MQVFIPSERGSGQADTIYTSPSSAAQRVPSHVPSTQAPADPSLWEHDTRHSLGPTHRAAVLQGRVREPAVALSPHLHIIGALDEQGLLEVAGSFVQVGDAVLTVVGDVLRALGGQ